MLSMYRYMINDTECGGCVMATNKEEAKVKVKSYYAQELGESIIVSVWVDDELSADIIQVYP